MLILAWNGFTIASAAQPALQIELLPGARIQMAWPGSASEYRLEQANALTAPIPWRAVPEAPLARDGRLVVVLTAGAAPTFFRLHQGTAPLPLTRVASSSPAPGEHGVAVTRETILRLTGPLQETAQVDGATLHATFGGRRLLTRPERSSDGQTLTLFYLEPLPPNAQVTVIFDAAGLTDAEGRPVDPDGDGTPGGRYTLGFHTAGTTGLPGTGVEGRVFASERNPDGSNRPLANVTITVDGAEEMLRTTTDAAGFFRLMPAPAGRFFVHIDGRTAVGSAWPGGAYYPFIGKAWEAVAGRSNNPAGGTGEIFLPLILGNALQPVSATEETPIRFSPEVVAANPGLDGVEVRVPPNALFNENGTRGGRVGIAPVAPDRLPEPLPPGLNLPLVITLQTDGAQNFDRPVPVTFPNLPDPVTGMTLGPGARTVLWSFNHDTGRWEAQGTATISADGRFAITDPGVGIRQPGWHGVGARIAAIGAPRPPLPSECQGDDCPECVQTIFCNVTTKEGQHYALCALKCLGNIVDELFDDEASRKSNPFMTGLWCIGGPDKCPTDSNESLTPERRDCYDKCRYPESRRLVHVVPCEGFFDPCEADARRALASTGSGRHDDAGLLPDRLAEQARYWEAEGDYLARLAGTPKVLQNTAADVPKLITLFQTFTAHTRVETPAGIHLSPEERAQLAALPRPGQFTAAEWQLMIDRLDALQGQPLPADVAAAKNGLTSLIALLQQRGWKGNLDGLVHGHLRLSRARAPQFGSADFPARRHYFLLKHHQSGFVQRGRLTTAGEFEQLVLAPSSLYTILYLDPVTGRSGGAFFQTGDAGSPAVVPSAPFEALPADEPDADADGLPDFSEEIVGTNPDQGDSDLDGFRDGAEVAGGSNPLDGTPQALGTLAAADTPGTAVDVTAWNDLAAVADTAAGVTLFDVSDPFAPVRLSQFDTPGEAQSVAGAGALLAVADRTEGVALLDLADPAAPILRAQVRFDRQARAVTWLGGQVVAGLASGDLVVLDASGNLVSRTPGDNRAIQDVLALNGFVYVLKPGTLEVYSSDGSTLAPAGSVPAEGTTGAGGRRWRLAGGGTRLVATHAQGFHVFDIAAPLSPLKLRSFSDGRFGWKHLVPDGNGWSLAAVDANSTDDGPHDVSVVALGTGGIGTNLVATLITPGIAGAIAFHRGAALVADGPTGLSVVNYQARDFGTAAPNVTVATRLRPGTQTLEHGDVFSAVTEASDDVAISHVEFHLDGQLVALDGNHPYEAVVRSPSLPPGETRFTLRARAVDTAGNAAWSAPILIDPSRDQTGPRVLQVRPGSTERFAAGMTVPVFAEFDEPVQSATLADGFRLVNLGPDGSANTPDDSIVNTLLQGLSPTEFSLAFPGTLPVGAYQVQILPQAADLAGNPVPAAVTWDFQVQPLGEFVGTTSLIWGVQAATAGNWSFARLPTIDDVVRIALPDGRQIRVAGQALAYDVRAATPLAFDPNTIFRLAHEAVFDGPLMIGRAGTWQGGRVVLRSTTHVLGALTVVNQDWTNEGQLVLGPHANLSFRNAANVRTTLRNAPGATLELVDSDLSTPPLSAGPVDFVNEGRIVARGALRSSLDPTRFVQLGSLEVTEGTLVVASGDNATGPAQHLGTTRVDAGATLDVSGHAEFGRASRVHGAGTVRLAASPIQFRGTYETDGTNLVPGSVTFGGDVRTTGPWNNAGGHAFFTGFSPRLGDRFVSEGALTVSAQPRLEAVDLDVYRDLTVTTELLVRGALRLDSGTTPGGTIAKARLLGTGRLRALGAVTFAGIVNSDEQGVLEISGTAAGEGPTILQFDNRGYALRILPGGTFDLSGIERVTTRGGVTNEGTLLKSDATVTELTRTLHNQGQIRVSAGTLLVRNGRYLQTSGSLVLAGGDVAVNAGVSSTADTTVSLEGGLLEGSGRVSCASLTNLARISPGAPIGVLDLQVGDHPVFSIYEQPGSGTLTLDITGPGPGTGHDQVLISGRAKLGGILELRPGASLDPAPGQEYLILTCAAREGTFATVTGDRLGGGKRLEVVYEDTQVKLRVVNSP